jgi:hypothetical protein
MFQTLCISPFFIFKILKMLVKILSWSTLISVGSCYLLCMLAIYVFTVSSCVWVHEGVEMLRGQREWGPFKTSTPVRTTQTQLDTIWMKSSHCVLNLYIPLLYIHTHTHTYIYIYYSSVNTTILYRQRLKPHVLTYKVTVRLAKNYETLTKWLHAFGIPDGLQYVPWFAACVYGKHTYCQHS